MPREHHQRALYLLCESCVAAHEYSYSGPSAAFIFCVLAPHDTKERVVRPTKLLRRPRKLQIKTLRGCRRPVHGANANDLRLYSALTRDKEF